MLSYVGVGCVKWICVVLTGCGLSRMYIIVAGSCAA